MTTKLIVKDKNPYLWKDFYIWTTIQHNCSKCWNLIEKNFEEEPIFEQSWNQPIEDYLYCDNCEQEDLIKYKIIVKIKLEK